jgi:hypothetical protein
MQGPRFRPRRLGEQLQRQWAGGKASIGAPGGVSPPPASSAFVSREALASADNDNGADIPNALTSTLNGPSSTEHSPPATQTWAPISSQSSLGDVMEESGFRFH